MGSINTGNQKVVFSPEAHAPAWASLSPKNQSPRKIRQKRKEPPGNRAALSSGRIVPTEAKPSELSGCIVGAGDGSVKEKSMKKYRIYNQLDA
jgi:hypothetical protein